MSIIPDQRSARVAPDQNVEQVLVLLEHQVLRNVLVDPRPDSVQGVDRARHLRRIGALGDLNKPLTFMTFDNYEP